MLDIIEFMLNVELQSFDFTATHQGVQCIKAVCSLLFLFFILSQHVELIVATTRPGSTRIPHINIYAQMHTHTCHTVCTSLPSASSTSPLWSPVFASTWLVSGPTGRFQFLLMENTGGSMWTARFALSCWMVRLIMVISHFIIVLK